MTQRVLGVALSVVALSFAACGDDGGDATPSQDDVETTVVEAEPTGDTEPDVTEDEVDTTLAEDGSGDEVDDAGGPCEVLAVEEVAAAAGLPLEDVGPQYAEIGYGDGAVQTGSITATGCSFEGEGHAEVEIVLLDPQHDAAAAYQGLFDQSAASTFGDFEHTVVEGFGDAAFFDGVGPQDELTIMVGDTILFVEGHLVDGESLGREELQAVAELALAALG